MISNRFFLICARYRLHSVNNAKQVSLLWEQNRYLSRSISRIPRRTPNNNVIQSVSPRLIESIEKRLDDFKIEVDLGLGPVIEESKDILEESIIKAVTIEHLKEIIATNYRNMDAHHISQCFQTINNIVKFSNNTETACFDLLGSKEFLLLANRTLKLARYMEPSEALQTLIAVQKIGISLDTLLSQSLLQIIRYSINEYSINELSRIVGLLKAIQKTNPTKSTLIDAIMLALPYAVKNRISNKEIDFYSARALLRCLEVIAFFGNNFYDVESLRKCFHFINKSMNQLNLQESINLLSYIYALNVTDPDCVILSKSLASKCIDRILLADKAEMNNLPSYIWINVLTKMKRNHHFYNRKLFKFLSEHSNNNPNFTTNELYFILSQNWNFKFVDYNLLSHFANLIAVKDVTIFGEESRISPTNLLKYFTLPPDCDKIYSNFTPICENILQSQAFETEMSKFRMAVFYFLNSCIILNVKLKENLIKEWFSKYLQLAFEETISTSKRHIFLKTFASIYQGLVINKDSDLNDETKQDVERKLQPYLEEYIILLSNELASRTNSTLDEIHFFASGPLGDWNLTKNYITRSGLVVDLLAQKNDTNKSIGFVLLSRQNYCREPPIIDGQTQFQLRMLKMCNIYPIVIDSNRWKLLNDSEKDHFVQNKINFALGHQVIARTLNPEIMNG